MAIYKRVLLKLSGEALMGEKSFGISPEMIERYAKEVKSIVDLGVQVALVIGGGNIFRGLQAASIGIERVQGDQMGMLATVINGMALQGALEKLDIKTRLMSAISIEQVCEPYIKRRAVRHLEKGRVVIFGAGLGSPYFTTDTAAALRANEIEADVLLKGTSVDGIYTADPKKVKTASKFETISFAEVISKELSIMDQKKYKKCKENNLPIIVFNIKEDGNILKIKKNSLII